MTQGLFCPRSQVFTLPLRSCTGAKTVQFKTPLLYIPSRLPTPLSLSLSLCKRVMAIEPPFSSYIESQRRPITPSSSSSSCPSSHPLPSVSSSPSLPLPSSTCTSHDTVISIDRNISRNASFRPSRGLTLDDERDISSLPSRTPSNLASATSNSAGMSNNVIIGSNNNGGGRRLSLTSSGFWVSIELFFTLTQILAAIVVLALSQNERPETPLPVWVIGYAVGCGATLPLLYWRYIHHPPVELLDQEALAMPVQHYHHHHHQGAWPPVTTAVPVAYPAVSPLEPVSNVPVSNRMSQSFSRTSANVRVDVCMERLRMSLDCFFAVWFVLGNVWVFGRPSSAEESPKLYRLCVAFLALSCISYAMPFVLCAAVCCCLPCVISLLGFRESHMEGRGASADVIASLPIYKFRSKRIPFQREKSSYNGSDSDSSSEGGVMAAGTENERVIAGDDAACCICLGRYKDNAQLRGLPCSHHFHVECVDQWLRINASCPLCKSSVQGCKTGDGDTDVSTPVARRGRRLFEEV